MAQVMIVAIASTEASHINIGVYIVVTLQTFIPINYMQASAWIKLI